MQEVGEEKPTEKGESPRPTSRDVWYRRPLLPHSRCCEHGAGLHGHVSWFFKRS